jgi:hypothetical protein
VSDWYKLIGREVVLFDNSIHKRLMNRREAIRAAVAVAAIPAIPFKAPAAPVMRSGFSHVVTNAPAAVHGGDIQVVCYNWLTDVETMIKIELDNMCLPIEFTLEPGEAIEKVVINERWERTKCLADVKLGTQKDAE